MATSLPRSSGPSHGPPTAALPALPVGKTRKSTGGLAAPASKSTPSTPKSGLRAPSTTFLPPTTPAPTTALPQPRAVSAVTNGAAKTIRKTVSINSFPQPPKQETRVSSLPPSPLSNGAIPPRKMKTPSNPNYSLGGTPSLLNGTGEGKSVARAGQRTSDGVISVTSPTQSRSSSAQDSYSTSATQYDDFEGPSQKSNSTDANEKRLSKADGKGNVVVSVRVRPDANGQDHSKTEGEWMVEGRKSLVSYKGKEGGDYYYGEISLFILQSAEANIVQIMFSRPTIITLEYTTILRSG